MDGADQGIKYYLTPQWDKLFERKVSSLLLPFVNDVLDFFSSFPVFLFYTIKIITTVGSIMKRKCPSQ